MIQKGHKIQGANALILGVTFKEDCPDIRNSRVIDIFTELKQFGLNVDVYDPHADSEEVEEEYGIKLTPNMDKQYDAIVLAVSHREFLSFDFKKLRNGHDTVIFDTKSFLDRNLIDARL
jgi:UDP-N-acetyl-D-galactosamine dehydrogenase